MYNNLTSLADIPFVVSTASIGLMDARQRGLMNPPAALASSLPLVPATAPPPPPPVPGPSTAPASAVPSLSPAVAQDSSTYQYQALDDVSASIQRSLALLHQLHCSVSSFTLSSQLTLLDRLNGVIKELSTMHSAAEDCHFQIPVDVIRLVDEGKNPDEFTKDLFNSCIQRNQATKGKVDAFKALRKHLLEEVEEAYPEETEAYRALRTAAALEARKMIQGQTPLANGNVKVKMEH
ncbi:hypothetical protein KP509_06G078500 [Ceratopteris richardii]|uniref:Mediator of RNA polymerase II transcription subunit 10 n=1 Tax=Ceratopteris richardii TaxID=49495 RepID=A0A8T2UUJ1_CERRI|nr:hypothetical protein KP509_06G078500 [Ceratopteris richardii]KAH7435759.1 hypothetical protein KP509_06G078500 [Ceratopteris richardii]